MSFHIGTTTKGHKFVLPPDAVTQTFAFIAKRGVGKTYAASVVVEEMLTHLSQVAVIDPLDCWYGLRSGADGRSAGMQIAVIGGEHGDLPLSANSGEIIADFVVENNASVVLSIRHLSKNEQRQFVTAFCERLYHRKGEGKYRTPLHLVIDEADEFAPQRLFHGTERCFGAVDTIVRRGRSSGIGVTLISQRSAAINKDCLTQAEVMVALRTISPQDRKAIEAWIEAHDAHDQKDEFMASLASLPIGTAWFWSPGWLEKFEKITIRRRKTFDSSATPKVGSKPVVPHAIARVDIEELKARLASIIEQKKADDPRELRKRITELERMKRGAPDKGEIKALVDKQAMASFKDGWERAYALLVSRDKKVIPQIKKMIEQLNEMVSTLSQVLPSPKHFESTTLTPVFRFHTERVNDRGETDDQEHRNCNGGTYDLSQDMLPTNRAGSSGMKRIMIALAQCPNGLTSRQIGVRAGLSSRSGTFATYLGKLRSLGYIAGGRGGSIKITETGIASIGDYEPLPTGHALFQYWMRELGQSGAARILGALHSRPSGLSREAILEVTGMSNSGTFATYMGKLRALDLIQKISPSEFRASEDLF